MATFNFIELMSEPGRGKFQPKTRNKQGHNQHHRSQDGVYFFSWRYFEDEDRLATKLDLGSFGFLFGKHYSNRSI